MKSHRIFLIVITLIITALFAYQLINKSPKQSQSENFTAKVIVNGQAFDVELAKTPEQKEKGLSNVKSLDQNYGMLFLFDKPTSLTFWMKDMRFPIDIIFINGNTITSVAHSAPPPTSPDAQLPLYSGEGDKVLEINAGLSKKYNIKKGDKIEINL
jgi:uncharacterized protein